MALPRKHSHRLLRLNDVSVPAVGEVAHVIDVPAAQQHGWGDHLAGVGVVGAAFVDGADDIQGVGVAGGEHHGVAVVIGGSEASSIQGSHAGGFVGEADVVRHCVIACSVELARRWAKRCLYPELAAPGLRFGCTGKSAVASAQILRCRIWLIKLELTL